MKTALQVFSWIAIVLGALAIISGISSISVDPQSAYYSLLGGALFLTEGVLAIAYIK